MATTSGPTPEARELKLLDNAENRIAFVESDAKLQDLITKFLCPILLKLASDNEKVLTKALGVCQTINRRLKSSPTITTPIQPLLEQFRKEANIRVKQFDLMYIKQGLDRLSQKDGLEILPQVLQLATPPNPADPSSFGTADKELWRLAFHLLLRLLPSWPIPERGSALEDALKERLSLTPPGSDLLATCLGKFLLYDGQPPETGTNGANEGAVSSTGRRNAGLSAEDVHFMSKFDESPENQPFGARLSQTKTATANFLFTSTFSDSQRFIPAVILSSDSTNLTAFRIGDTMFKQCIFDLELSEHINQLFSLYWTSRPRVQMRILALLSKSQLATTHVSDILRIIEHQVPSLSEGLEATKLRAALFTFINWVVRMEKEADFQKVASKAQTSFRNYIESQGWPNPQEINGTSLSHAEADQRSKAYESIGILSRKVQPDIDMVKWLFTSLRCDISSSQMHVSVEEALGRVLTVFTINDDRAVNSLKSLLLWTMTTDIGQEDPDYGHKTRRNTKYAALRYANRCLSFNDIDARFIDLLALDTGDTVRSEVTEEATKGLDPYWWHMNLKASRTFMDSATIQYPDFASLVRKFFGHPNEPLQEPQGSQSVVFAAAVGFCRNIFIEKALRNTESSLTLEPDWERRIDAIIENNENGRAIIRSSLREVDQPIIVRFLEASLMGLALGLGRCGHFTVELCSLASNTILSPLLAPGLRFCELADKSINLESHRQSARIFGILASHPHNETRGKQIQSLIPICGDFKGAVGRRVLEIRSALLKLTFLLTRMNLRGYGSGTQDSLNQLSQILSNMLENSHDNMLKAAAIEAISEVGLCTSAGALPWKLEGLIEILSKQAKKEQNAAAAALGHLAWSLSTPDQAEAREKSMTKLFALHEVRNPDLQFAVGAALSVAAAGWQSKSTMITFDVDVDSPPSESSLADTGLLSEILQKAIDGCRATKPSLRKASAIWLLCLVQYCGTQSTLKLQLRQCQVAFARLLSDRDDVVQETGSRGLGLVYTMGDRSVQEDLVRDLVQSFTANDTKMSGTVDEDTQLFEAGTLPTEGGASVTTYKDIVSLATEMGDPSLVYRFMNLASHNAIWSSRAAFGKFGLGNVLADSSYLAENKKFYPKLYRYRFDPNPNVQRSMNEIWSALVKDPNKVIDENFDLIITDLLKSILGKEWRVREGSCAALADLVQGREVDKYEGYLDDVWNVSFKVLDDIKSSVRIAAMVLCRTLTNLLIRNLEVGDGTTKRAKTMLAHAVPFLLQQLENGGAKDVQQYAIITLLDIIKKSPPKSLSPFAPTVLEKLILSMSLLEHESINYLHLNADKHGLTTEKLDKMRVSSLKSSPLTEAVERCLESLDTTAPEGTKIVKEALRKLEGTFKSAIGLPSRVALAGVVVSLVVRHNTLFKPYSDRFVQLLRKHVLDRNDTVSVAFSTSLSYVLRLASDKQVQDTAVFTRKLYFDAEEAAHRIVAAEIVNSISKNSNDVLKRFATSFLPLAFVGRSDTEESVRDRFAEAWKDNVGGSLSINLYLSEIVDLISANINSTRWAVKHACCLAVADIITSMDVRDQYSLSQAELIWPVLEQSLSGKTWAGKEKVVAAYPTFVKKARCLWGEEKKGKEMTAIALREARRTSVSYRPHAITALGEFARIREELDLSDEIMQILTAGVDAVASEGADHMEIDSDESLKHAGEGVVERTVAAIITCMFQILTATSGSDVLERAVSIISKAKRTGSRATQRVISTALGNFKERIRISAVASGTAAEGSAINVSKEVRLFCQALADSDG